MDTFEIEEPVRWLLEFDRARDQVRNSRNVWFNDRYHIAFGDIDGDHDLDAAALVVWEYGATGWEQRLYVMKNNGNERWQIAAWECTARKLEPETFADEVAISNRHVVLKGGQNGVWEYSLHRGKLVQK